MPLGVPSALPHRRESTSNLFIEAKKNTFTDYSGVTYHTNRAVILARKSTCRPTCQITSNKQQVQPNIMAVSAHALFVVSTPKNLSREIWSEWYSTEHLPDVATSKTVDRGTLYHEIRTPSSTTAGRSQSSIDNSFLAMYQTPHANSMETENVKDIRLTTQLFKKEGAEDENIFANGEFDVRNYELIQVWDPNNVGNSTPSPQCLSVELHPPQDQTEDFEAWYRQEHLQMLSKVPGYRRSLRYKLGPRVPLTKGADDDIPTYLAIHEAEDVIKAFGSAECDEANATEWSRKHLGLTRYLGVRGWKMVSCEGW